MSIKNVLYRLTPPYYRHVYRAHKVYKELASDLNDVIAKREKTLTVIREKIRNGEKVRVAFLHMYATDCQDLSLFDMMLDSPYFDPYFIVNPDVMRSQEHLVFNYKRSLTELTEKYGSERVLEGYDAERNTYVDYTDLFDMASTNNPYDGMAQELFRIIYWSHKGIPVFYIPYYYMGLTTHTIENFKLTSSSFLWRFFLPNKASLSLAQEYEAIRGRNVIVTGYPKMDKISQCSVNFRERKRIIIAPHHLIQDEPFCRGGFREYAQDLLTLPSEFPNVDFVFRPHPQLKEALKAYWSLEQISQWLNKLLENPNVTYSTEGDYLDSFVNSDAIIHDCDSFVAECMYFNKPCAFVFRKGFDYKAMSSKFGISFFDNYYSITKKADWFYFIENVVIAGHDDMKNKRERFGSKMVMCNYPHATRTIYNHILKSLKK